MSFSLHNNDESQKLYSIILLAPVLISIICIVNTRFSMADELKALYLSSCVTHINSFCRQWVNLTEINYDNIVGKIFY